MKRASIFALVFLLATSAGAQKLNEKLEIIRKRKLAIEKTLVSTEQSKKTTHGQLSRLKRLQALQKEEKKITQKRMAELGAFVEELSSRKWELQKRLDRTQGQIRKRFAELVHPAVYGSQQFIRVDQSAAEKRLREQILSSVILLELKDFEAIYADFLDVEDLESRIEQEKQQIASLMADLSEQESLIEFHKKIRENLTQEKHEEHLRQLNEYRELKKSEVEIEKMIGLFQERQKLQKETDQKKRISMIALKPKSLPWPLKGKLVGMFGQQKDESSGLNVFKKGIEILTFTPGAPVIAVMEGEIKFAGPIPGKGMALIIQHPRSVYTVYAGMKNILLNKGDTVTARQKIGEVESQSGLYFEIRAKNVAIDPLKWLE